MDSSEYEISQFGFSAKQVSLERRLMLTKILDKALEAIIEKLTTLAETRNLLTAQKYCIMKNLLESFEPHLKHCDNLDKKYFSIPSHVLLPADFELAKEYSSGDEELMDAELQKLEQRFLINSMMLAHLKMECTQHDEIMNAIKDESNVHKQLREVFAKLDLKRLSSLVDNIHDITKI